MARETIFADNSGNTSPNGHVGNESNSGGEPNATGSNAEPAREPRFSFIDPSSIGSEGSSGNSDSVVTGEPVRKRRGRKPGSKNSKGAQTIPVEGFASILFQSHAMLAALTKTQEMELAPDEAMNLAQAIANVSRHYDVQLAAKTIDWTNLLMAAATVYGTRLMAMRMRVAAERKARPPKSVNPTNSANAPSSNDTPGVGQVPDEYYREFVN